MNILWLFDTAGLIFGPAIILAGIVALAMCVRSTVKPALRGGKTILVALMPFGLAIIGALVGLGIVLNEGRPGGVPSDAWLALGKVCVAGLTVTALPLLWAVVLVRGK